MRKNKAFTILELLVVVAIIAIIAIIAIPNFIGRIDEAKESRELAEINAVGKAVSTYYADFGNYPTLQGKDGTLLQPQPVDGAPHNIDFSSLVPDYLATLPNFSYWWIDAQGKVYHTQNEIGTIASSLFTPTTGYTYTLYKADGSTQVLSAPYTLQVGEYVIGKDESGAVLPKISSVFKNAKMHPEDPEYVANIPVTSVSLNKTTMTLVQGDNETLLASVAPSNATNKSILWTSSNTAVATVNSDGLVTAVANGTATITVTTVGENRTATCTVTVNTVFTSQIFSYTSSVQSFIVPVSGKYSLEVWGSQGGSMANVTGDSFSNNAIGGKGGYARGDLNLVQGQQLYIYVGGQGVANQGGWNGGGHILSPQYILGGGGATDIRLVTGLWNDSGSLKSRIIVAGGGGGSTWSTAMNGGAGGGTSGLLGQKAIADRVVSTGATQSSGGIGGQQGTNYGANGSFGVGGSANSNNAHNGAGGGGGGWYGGGGGANAVSGAGGSSYVLTASSHKPSGYNPATTFYMTNTQVIAGNASMPTLNGGTQTGQTGNGQAKITYVSP